MVVSHPCHKGGDKDGAAAFSAFEESYIAEARCGASSFQAYLVLDKSAG